ncbi:MAG: universal stress protein [Candidatus Methanosuratincola sp.]|jgi:nucleotide-binding universal stress UspA family protein|nr:universal stress protein [Candidatus Methanosuratincola sp.]
MSAKTLCPTASFFDGFDKVRSNYRSIMAAVDYSYVSAKVLERAILLSKANCAKLHIVHVVRTKLPLQSRQTTAMDPSYRDVLLKDAATLFEVAGKKASEAGIEHTTMRLEGDPAEEIIKYAGENDIELIVVGSKEKPSTYAPLGSVSSKVATEAHCSVLIER